MQGAPVVAQIVQLHLRRAQAEQVGLLLQALPAQVLPAARELPPAGTRTRIPCRSCYCLQPVGQALPAQVLPAIVPTYSLPCGAHYLLRHTNTSRPCLILLMHALISLQPWAGAPELVALGVLLVLGPAAPDDLRLALRKVDVLPPRRQEAKLLLPAVQQLALEPCHVHALCASDTAPALPRMPASCSSERSLHGGGCMLRAPSSRWYSWPQYE